MPPFQYRTVQDPYVGSITNLMGAGSRARAQSIREVGDIRAKEALEKGAITSQMIGSLGQIAGEGYESHQEAKADQIYNDLIKTIDKETISFDRTDRLHPQDMPGASTGVGPAPPTEQVSYESGAREGDYENGIYTEEPIQDIVPPSPESLDRVGYTSEGPGYSRINTGDTGFLGPQMPGSGTGLNEPPPPVPDQSWPGVLGDITEGQRADRGRLFTHITDDGRHDITTLRSALIEKGVPPTQVRRLLSRASERNEAIAQFNEANAKENAREEDIQHDRNLIVLYETYGNHPTQSQFIQVLGRKRGMEDYTKYLNLENASSVLRQAQRENLPSVLRSIVAGVRGLYGTGRAQSGAFAAMIDSHRAELGDDLAQGLIDGGIDGLEATIKSQLAVIDPPAKEDPLDHEGLVVQAEAAQRSASNTFGAESPEAAAAAGQVAEARHNQRLGVIRKAAPTTRSTTVPKNFEEQYFAYIQARNKHRKGSPEWTRLDNLATETEPHLNPTELQDLAPFYTKYNDLGEDRYKEIKDLDKIIRTSQGKGPGMSEEQIAALNPEMAIIASLALAGDKQAPLPENFRIEQMKAIQGRFDEGVRTLMASATAQGIPFEVPSGGSPATPVPSVKGLSWPEALAAETGTATSGKRSAAVIRSFYGGNLPSNMREMSDEELERAYAESFSR